MKRMIVKVIIGIIAMAVGGGVEGQSECGLNLSAYPVVGYEECGWVEDPMDGWDSFPNTLCCRNALTVLSQALALRARNSPQQSLFIPYAEWDACSHSFLLLHGISPDSCGFHNLYHGPFQCSLLNLPDILGQHFYQSSLDHCSHFDLPSSISCASCLSSVLTVRDSLYRQLLGARDIPLERAVCGVASLVSLAAAKPDDPALSDKFLRCWPPPLDNTGDHSPSLPPSHLYFSPLIFIILIVSFLAGHPVGFLSCE